MKRVKMDRLRGSGKRVLVYECVGELCIGRITVILSFLLGRGRILLIHVVFVFVVMVL